MDDTLTGCPERQLEPKERKDVATKDPDEIYQYLEDEKYEHEFV